ncbi:hypothetical protein EG68_03628 [Paragonimus skrjabini miyazakii]|uniref:LITAF domain-containing protein n=1 Tax=Paragonimus skrjabini miyazakii TaxID=59628 RepID=A0A8S9Z0K8_9TREM|nr:hypothetical protein EG68_03628 [Paragonimus skrjabini miyazakii]
MNEQPCIITPGSYVSPTPTGDPNDESGRKSRSNSLTTNAKPGDRRKAKKPTKHELRRYSVQCMTEQDKVNKLPYRPSLYGYPSIGTRPSIPLGTTGSETASAKSSIAEHGTLSEEPQEPVSQMKSGKTSITEEPVKLGREPVVFRCQTCQQSPMTVTTFHVGAITWLAAVLIFLCGGILGCFLIPFYTNCCKNVKHTCPVCDTEVGMVKPI